MPPFRTSARRSVAALAVLATACLATPAFAVRIMNHNLLNWSGSSGPARVGFMLSITRGVQPDLVASQEVTDQAGVDLYLNSVLNWREPGQWLAAPFNNGPDTDNALWYKPSKWTYLDKKQIPTALRDITRWHLRLAGYESPEAEIYLYSMHLKASTGFEADRLAEMKICRRDAETTLPVGAHVLFVGDLNTYNYSTETCFQWALSDTGQNIGRMRDPINKVGQWHDNVSYALYHTQSPRDSAFGGGATGGMDDRFDWILTSYNWQDGLGMDVDASTYKAYGNNGQHCCNGAIHKGNTSPYTFAAMESLMRASDHIPVQVDLIVPAKAVPSASALAFGTVFVGATAGQPLSLSNAVTELPADYLDYSFDTAPPGFGAPVDPYTAAPGASGPVHVITMDTGSPGAKSGSLGIFTDAPDSQFIQVALSGTVVAHALPSADSLASVPEDSLDFGTQGSGGFSDRTADVWNFGGASALQGRLRVASAAITGPGAARFTLVEPFAPALIAGESARYDVHFDDSGLASDTTLVADLVFQTEDDPSVPGAQSPLAPVTYHLIARFTQSTIGIEDELPTATVLYAPSPNPSRTGRVQMRFDLAQEGRASIELYDVRGRRIAVLADGVRPAGRHSVLWDGTDSAHRAVANGVYFARLVTEHGTQSKRFLVLQ